MAMTGSMTHPESHWRHFCYGNYREKERNIEKTDSLISIAEIAANDFRIGS